MELTHNLSTELPFPGFYESLYSSALDGEAEQWADYEAEYRQDEENVPLGLRLTAGEYAEIVFNVSDHQVAALAVAKEHVAAFECIASERLGFKLNLDFEEMTSPREYNFDTDRVFASIPYGRVLRMAVLSRRNHHVKLAAKIAERFTHRDGFFSSYSNALGEWLDKPLADWDHNEVGTLLLAVYDLGDNTDDDLEIYEHIHKGFYRAWESSVNWTELDARVQELHMTKGE